MNTFIYFIYVIAVDLMNSCFLLLFILFEPRATLRKRRVLFFGAPILSVKYIVEAIKPITDQSTSFVRNIFPVNSTGDFTYVSRNPLKFLYAIINHNIYLTYYDSFDIFFGPISKHLFFFYKRLKGKKVIIMPYGSDAWLYSKIPDLNIRHALNIEYRRTGIREKYQEKRYFYLNQNADFRLPCIAHITTLSTWDILPVHYYPIDFGKLSRIKCQKHSIFTIAHSPNHRGAKGTEFLIEAVRQLKEEGRELNLRIFENVNNNILLEELKKCHVLAEQFVLNYALSGMEGMALGLPVIAHLSAPHLEVFRRYSYLKECPIVNASSDVNEIKEAIKFTIKNYDDLCRKSLSYVQKYHSYEANAVMWNKIFQSLDTKENIINYFHPIIGEYYKDYEEYIDDKKTNAGS